jgi:hypothetical protein
MSNTPRVWMLLLLVACHGKDSDTVGGGDTHEEAPDPATVELAGPCEMAADFGGFSVRSAGDGTGVQGSVADGVVPITVLTEIGTAGSCRLLRQENPRTPTAIQPARRAIPATSAESASPTRATRTSAR